MIKKKTLGKLGKEKTHSCLRKRSYKTLKHLFKLIKINVLHHCFFKMIKRKYREYPSQSPEDKEEFFKRTEKSFIITEKQIHFKFSIPSRISERE